MNRQQNPVIRRVPLNSSLLALDDDQTEFLKSLTGITDVAALKEHIITMQEKAYQIYPFPCIRYFRFLGFVISSLPAYKNALQLYKTKPGAILLDLGCFFGGDTRRVVYDGWPAENIVASDLEPSFWDLGHEFFNTTPESFPVVFVPGDAFDPHMVQPANPLYLNDIDTITPRPSLRDLKTLTPLQGHVSAIYVSAVFHLFDEEQQETLARRLASLLSPEPGSVIFGRHLGLPEKGSMKLTVAGREVFCHSPQSWSELWNGLVFKEGTVKVEGDLKVVFEDSPDEGGLKHRMLVWSVTRL